MERYEEARDVYVKSLEINKQCLGEDHTATANSKWGLADVFKYYKAALVLYEQVLKTKTGALALDIMDFIQANGHPWPGLIKILFKCLATGGQTSVPSPSKTFYIPMPSS